MQDFFQGSTVAVVIDERRKSSQTGAPLGQHRYRNRIEAVLEQAVGQAALGRSNKNASRQDSVAGQEDLF